MSTVKMIHESFLYWELESQRYARGESIPPNGSVEFEP